MFAEYLNVFARGIKDASDGIRNNLAADAFHCNWCQCSGDNDVADRRVCFVAHHNISRFRDRLQSGGKIGFSADNRVIHSIIASEIANVAKTSVYSHSDTDWILNTGIAPLGVKASNLMLHLNGHAKTRLCIIDISFSFWIAKKDQHCVANKLVDSAPMSEGDSRHLGEIFVEKLRNLLWLETFRNRRKILYV